MIKFAIKIKIEKNDVIKMVINKKNYNNFFYFYFLYKKIGLYKK